MDLDDLREMSAVELTAVLDALGIDDDWQLGGRIRADTMSLFPSDGACLGEPAPKRREGFQNQVVGRLAEVVFREVHLAALEEEDFEIEDLHEKGENRDFVVHRKGLELPINVKVACTRFEKARRIVALDPDDCIPVGAYKALGASEKAPDLLYVDLVDFALRERVDGFMNELSGPLGVGWHLLSWYGEKGAGKAEDRHRDALFETHAKQLIALVPDVERYRVISALRVLAILREHPRRVPGLGIRAAGRGGISGEVNVHVSIQRETQDWTELSARLCREGIGPLLEEVRRTATLTLPDPLL